jgi:DNA-binding NtrC family response regulator
MTRSLNYEVIPLDSVPCNESIILLGQSEPVVLVVDDERIIADTLSKILSISGYKVLTAYNGMSALELASTNEPALVITDVVMPGMTGVELAIAMTKVIPSCKILLFSGQAATVDLLEKAHDMGYDFSIISKPVHPTDMLRRVRESLEIHEMAVMS